MTRPSRYAYSLTALFILSLIRIGIGASAPPTLGMDTPPPIAECAEGEFTWQGGRPPYTALSVRDSHSGASVFSNSGLTDTVFHWVAAVAAGSELIVELMDTGIEGAGGGRVSDSFAVEAGSDSCLSVSVTSGSTTEQTSNTSTSPQSTSASTSTSSAGGGQRTTSETAPSPSSAPSSSDSTTTPATTGTETSSSPSSSSTNGAPSQTLTGSPAGTPGSTASTSGSSRTTPNGSSIEVATASTSTSPSTSGRSPTGPSTGAIAGAAVGSLVAGFVLAAGLFCVWRARRGTMQRQRRLEPYEYPSADPVRTHPAVPTARSPPDHENALDCERSLHQLNADPVVRERRRPDKARWDGPTTLPSMMQSTTSHGAERERVMDVDVDGAEGPGSQGIRAAIELVRRRWDLRDSDIENAFRGFDLADYSEHSTSTAPPPYSQIG